MNKAPVSGTINYGDPWRTASGVPIWPYPTTIPKPDWTKHTPLSDVRPANPLAQGLPTWFSQMPTDITYTLTPFAAAALRELFPVIPQDVMMMPYLAHGGGYLMPGGKDMPWLTEAEAMYTQGASFWGNPLKVPPVPYVGPTVGFTEAVIPEVASAQVLKNIKSTGAEPVLRRYMESIGVPWDTWLAQGQSLQPQSTKPSRVPRWGAVKQR